MRAKARLAGATLALLLAGCGPGAEPLTEGGPVQMRRLTETQYRQSIADIFGADIKVGGRFEPEMRVEGLLAVGANEVTVTRAGFEQYDAMARQVAAQVVDEAHRDALVGCRPADPKAPDDACARTVLARHGRMLMRHPMPEKLLAARVAAAAHAARESGEFYAGLQYALSGLLVSPEFLFRVDGTETDPTRAGQNRLDGFSRAQRLSFLLWNSTPDEELLRAAEAGELTSKAGLARQVDRLLASPRLEAGVRAFFSDFLGFDAFDSLEKDPLIYPAFNHAVMIDAQEQALKLVTDQLVRAKGDYRDLFTTRQTFMTRALGVPYDLPVAAEQGWEAQTFAKDDPRAGMLTLLSFTALHSHPGRSSATLRGKAIRELLLCQPVPAPPNNVDFAIVQDTNNPNFRTARDRLTAHRSDPTCAGCHQVIDPIGLALEHFDGLGQFRARENGAEIDTSGDLDGRPFKDAAGLGQALHDNPQVPHCLVSSLYRFAAGRSVTDSEKPFIDHLTRQFAADGHRIPALLRRIALSDAFYALAKPAGPDGVKEASNDR